MKSVTAKELASLARDGRIRLTAGLFAALLVGAIALGVVEHRSYEHQRHEASEVDQELWLDQGEKDPHSATHYGQYVFRPRSDLYWMDRGIDDLLGTTSFLESHRLGKAKHAAVESRPWAPPFIDLSPSSLVLVILPLLAMVLGHSTWNGERKMGTLATIIAAGADPRKILKGKLLALLTVTGALAGAAALLGLIVVLVSGGGMDSVTRWGLLAVVYAASTWIYTLIGVLASVVIRSPAKSLLAVLGCWVLTMILVPRTVNSLANQSQGLPDQSSLDAMVDEMRANGIDGDDPRAERSARFKEEVLAEYGVEELDALPVNYSGLALQSREDYDNQIFDRMEETLVESRQSRAKIRRWALIFSPSVAARALSRLSAGTDQAHHAWFEEQTEVKRRAYVEALNDSLAFQAKGERSGSEELWQESSVGSITAPPISSLWRHALIPALSLLGWIVATLAIFVLVWRRADRDPVTLGE